MTVQAVPSVVGSGGTPPRPLAPYVWQLGLKARIHPYTGNVVLNYPLIESLAKHRQHVIPPLFQLLSSSMQPMQIVEGLYLAQRLAETKTPGVQQLYAAAARFNYTNDPLIQVYLAGFYRKLNVPEAFGPMLEMALRHAQQPRTTPFQVGLNPMEEVGGTLLQMMVERTADEVVKRLKSPDRPL